MERERIPTGPQRSRRRSYLRFGRTVVPIGLLIGIGTAGAIGGEAAIRAIVAAVTAVAVIVGGYAGLRRLASRYSLGFDQGETTIRGTDPARPVAADGSGEYE